MMHYLQSKKSHHYSRHRWHFLCLIFALLFTGQIFAQLELRKHTINSGGVAMSGDGYELKSSIGQIDSNNMTSGDNYQLNGGFWQQNTDLIFKNKF